MHVTSPTSAAVDSPQGRKIFVFDRVFGPEVTQDGVWEYLEESVNAFLQGYNVSVLAYGQSGAGKSYTMGTAEPGEHPDPNQMGEYGHPFPESLQTRYPLCRAPPPLPKHCTLLYPNSESGVVKSCLPDRFVLFFSLRNQDGGLIQLVLFRSHPKGCHCSLR